MAEKRTAIQQQVVEALISSKAINLEAVGSMMSKFGHRAALEGESLAAVINQKMFWACGWPGPVLDVIPTQIRTEKE